MTLTSTDFYIVRGLSTMDSNSLQLSTTLTHLARQTLNKTHRLYQENVGYWLELQKAIDQGKQDACTLMELEQKLLKHQQQLEALDNKDQETIDILKTIEIQRYHILVLMTGWRMTQMQLLDPACVNLKSLIAEVYGMSV